MIDSMYTTGEIAKKMGVSIRTLQLYDEYGILPPSGYSDGGRRLYTAADIILLQRILSLKELGYSIEKIKTSVPANITPEQATVILEEELKQIESHVSALENKHRVLSDMIETMKDGQNVDIEAIAEKFVYLRMMTRQEQLGYNQD